MVENFYLFFKVSCLYCNIKLVSIFYKIKKKFKVIVDFFVFNFKRIRWKMKIYIFLIGI